RKRTKLSMEFLGLISFDERSMLSTFSIDSERCRGSASGVAEPLFVPFSPSWTRVVSLSISSQRKTGRCVADKIKTPAQYNRGLYQCRRGPASGGLRCSGSKTRSPSESSATSWTMPFRSHLSDATAGSIAADHHMSSNAIDAQAHRV